MIGLCRRQVFLNLYLDLTRSARVDADTIMWSCRAEAATCGCLHFNDDINNLVDPASSHMLVSMIKPCMSQFKIQYCEAANGSLKQL